MRMLEEVSGVRGITGLRHQKISETRFHRSLKGLWLLPEYGEEALDSEQIRASI